MGHPPINDSQSGAIQLDASGVPTQVAGPLGGIPQYSWGGNWFVQGTQAASAVTLPFEADPAGTWAMPNGGPSQNEAEGALCGCLLQTDPGQGAFTAPMPIGQRSMAEAYPASVQLASIPNCAICNLASPTLPTGTSCTVASGTGSSYLILVGDPGHGIHNVGNEFNFAAQTSANSLQAQGNNVVACRVSSVQNVVAALTSSGRIDGGVIYFGHSGPFHDFSVNGNVSILAVGEGSGDDTNVSFRNVSQLSAVLTAFNGSQNIIGTNAAILLSGCNAGVEIYDAYAIFETSIAQQFSNKTQRGVYAYTVGLYFSQLDAGSRPIFEWCGQKRTKRSTDIYGS
jgi:hypothetical protein